MINVEHLKLTTIAQLIERGEHTSVEFTRAYLARIEKYNPKINAFIKVMADEALGQAGQADEEASAGKARGPLHGVPIAIKDIIDMKGSVTTAGGVLLPDEPAREDSEVVARLRRAGAVILGKLNLHEYAWGGTTRNVHFGDCINPWKEGYTPGGSSGGSGAAVAASLCAAALGTDTLGSVRIPSSYCGCAGIKPSFGLVATRGVYPLSWSLDSVGPLARNVEDAAALLQAIAGPDPKDPTSAMREPGNLAPEKKPSIDGVRIGVINDYSLKNDGSPEQKVVTDAASAAIDHLVSLGARRVDLDAPEIKDAGRIGINITLADAAAIHAEHMERNPDKIGEDVRQRLEFGAGLSAAVVAEAHHQKTLLRHRFDAIMRDVDCLIMPTTPTAAHAFDAGLSAGTATFTAAVNTLGYPAVSVRDGFTEDGLPIGLMIVAAAFNDSMAIRVAQAYETSTEWHKRRPDGFGPI